MAHLACDAMIAQLELDLYEARDDASKTHRRAERLVKAARKYLRARSKAGQWRARIELIGATEAKPL